MTEPSCDTIVAWLLSGRYSHRTDIHNDVAAIFREYEEFTKEKIMKQHQEWQRQQFIRERARRCEEPF